MGVKRTYARNNIEPIIGSHPLIEVHQGHSDSDRDDPDVFLAEKHDRPFLIWQDVGKPIVEVVKRCLLLLVVVRPDPSDLHSASASRIEVDIFLVGRVFGPHIEFPCGGQTRFDYASKKAPTVLRRLLRRSQAKMAHPHSSRDR